MFTKKPNVKGMHLDSLPVVLWSFTLEIWVYTNGCQTSFLCHSAASFVCVTILWWPCYTTWSSSPSHTSWTPYMSSSPNQWRSTTLLSPFLKMWRNRRRCSQRFTRLLGTPPPTIHHDGPWCRWLALGCSKAHPQGLGHSSHPLNCGLPVPSVSWWIEKRIKVDINLFSQTTHKAKV